MDRRLPSGYKLKVRPRQEEASLTVWGIGGPVDVPFWNTTEYAQGQEYAPLRINGTVYSQGGLGILYPGVLEEVRVFPKDAVVPGGLQMEVIKYRLVQTILKGEFMDVFVTPGRSGELGEVAFVDANILRQSFVEGTGEISVMGKSIVNHIEFIPDKRRRVNIAVGDNSTVGLLEITGDVSSLAPFLSKLNIEDDGKIRLLRVRELRIPLNPDGAQVQIPHNVARILVVLRRSDFPSLIEQKIILHKGEEIEEIFDVYSEDFPTRVVIDTESGEMKQLSELFLESDYPWIFDLWVNKDSGPLKFNVV